MKMRKATLVWLMALAVLALAVAGCTRSGNRRQSGEWTPAPITGSLAISTRAPDILPTLPPPTRMVAQEPAAPPTRVAPIATSTIAPTAPPTRDSGRVIITEEDVLRAVTSGAAAESGATLESVAVQFTADGKMILTAGRVSYGFVSADNVILVGRLIAVNGKLQLETESISPRGLVTSFIPTMANQALQQYTSRWYVEDVQTMEGLIDMRVRL